MKRSRFSEEQIIGILKEHEAGVSVADLCRKHGVSDASIYNWKARVNRRRTLTPDWRPILTPLPKRDEERSPG
ncbi:transposase, partial [Mesorhizobium sp. M1378]|uniref:transposase n=1 Tax=Mesorhizobium sp. M1378 TaxID=2957092 RepID=UPI0033385663